MNSRRGLAAAFRAIHNGKGRPQVFLSTTRQLSITSLRGLPRPSIRPLLSRTPHNALPLASPLSIRYASTAPSPVAQAVTPATHSASDSPAIQSDAEWNALFETLNENTVAAEPHIGYLKSLGVDFGWGTTSIIQWIFEHLHVYSGLPWAGSILTTVILGRLLVMKFVIESADQSGRMAVIGKQMKPLTDKMTRDRLEGNSAAAMQGMQQMRQIYKDAGVKPARIFIPFLIQIPLGFGIWRLTRTMADLPVPGLENGGFLWFQDLTVLDPTFILPLATSGMLFLTLKKGGEMGAASGQNPTMLKAMQWGLPVISLLFMSYQPAASQLVFVTGSVWGYMQGAMLRSDKVRAWYGIQPLPKKEDAAAASGPYKGTITMHKNASGTYSSTVPDQETTSQGFIAKQWNGVKSTFSGLTSKLSKSSATRKQAQRDRQRMMRAKEYEQRRRVEIENERKRRNL